MSYTVTLIPGDGIGPEVVAAAVRVLSATGIDFDWETWRFMAGARWEDYQQAVLPVDLLDYSGVSIVNLQAELLDPNQRLAIREDDVFASAALTRLAPMPCAPW